MVDPELEALFKELQVARNESIAAEKLCLELSKKYGDLCIRLLVWLRFLPNLPGFEKRSEETDAHFLHPYFWNSELIISLYEYLKESYMENPNA